MKIKLILAADPNDPLSRKNPFKPLSLSLLAASAPEHDYELIDMLWDNPESAFNEPAELVGISVRKSSEKAAFELADSFRTKNVKVILGGPQPSANPVESLEHADAVVVGEGEELWVQLLKDIENNNLKDYYVSAPAKFNANGHSVYRLEQLPSLDKIPLPNRDLFKNKYDFELVFASRGCAINCDFCSVTRLFGSKYRFRPVDEVVKEISGFKGYYYLIDDTVFGRSTTYDYYLELYEKILKLKKIKYWTGQANLDAAASEKGREVIRKAARSGLLYAAIGMESINKKVLKKSGSYSKMGIAKADDVIEKMKENTRFIQDQGILISAWFAIGYEDEEIDTYYKTWEFCKEMNLIPVFSPVQAMQGTDLYDRLNAEGKLQDNAINITNVGHPTISNQQVIEALEYVNKKGFGLLITIKRTFFYLKKFIAQKEYSIGEIIHKTIFTFITQRRFGKITKLELEKMKRKIQ